LDNLNFVGLKKTMFPVCDKLPIDRHYRGRVKIPPKGMPGGILKFKSTKSGGNWTGGKHMKTIKAGSLRGHIFFWLAITTSIFPAHAQTAQTNLAVTVRHAPSLNGGTIQGSLQQINGENVTANGGFAMTGDLLVPGTPTLRLNGNPTYSGVAVGSGSFSPSGYQVTLNGNCSLHYLRTQTTPVSLPTVSAPPSPTGTRSVTGSATAPAMERYFSVTG